MCPPRGHPYRQFAIERLDPEENPILVKSNKINTFQGTETSIQSSGLLKPNYQILSPDNNSKLLSEDLMISLSYFKMEDIDPTYTKIYINDKSTDIKRALNSIKRAKNRIRISKKKKLIQ